MQNELTVLCRQCKDSQHSPGYLRFLRVHLNITEMDDRRK